MPDRQSFRRFPGSGTEKFRSLQAGMNAMAHLIRAVGPIGSNDRSVS